MRIFYTTLLLLIISRTAAQVTISGTVYDLNKTNYVKGVTVVSTGGFTDITDSLGRYKIMVADEDSLTFIYNNKPTRKFAVSEVPRMDQFDISLMVTVPSKYGLLGEVKVYARSYKQDSIDNREEYADIFDYKKPGLSSNMSGGVAGADLGELINIFRFRRNKQLRSFQRRLEQQETDKYVDSRFNKKFVARITGLPINDLDSFMIWFRPSYEFVLNSSEIEFNQYILNSSYLYRKFTNASPAKLPDQ